MPFRRRGGLPRFHRRRVPDQLLDLGPYLILRSELMRDSESSANPREWCALVQVPTYSEYVPSPVRAAYEQPCVVHYGRMGHPANRAPTRAGALHVVVKRLPAKERRVDDIPHDLATGRKGQVTVREVTGGGQDFNPGTFQVLRSVVLYLRDEKVYILRAAEPSQLDGKTTHEYRAVTFGFEPPHHLAGVARGRRSHQGGSLENRRASSARSAARANGRTPRTLGIPGANWSIRTS